ncbi:MAG: zinc ribbon domain-containing protein [Promethearchaeati archaeon SRVP18_Atabeyarchaeia-1]
MRNGFEQAACPHCHATVAPAGAKFCYHCGSKLQAGAGRAEPQQMEEKGKSRQTLVAQTQETEKCMVCGLELKQRDDVVWCPHCGRLAHRADLIGWIRERKSCPACGEGLSEEYYT